MTSIMGGALSGQSREEAAQIGEQQSRFDRLAEFRAEAGRPVHLSDALRRPR